VGFLAKANEEKAAAALEEAVRSGNVSFLCIRCDRTSTEPEGAASSLCGTCRKWIAAARLYPVELIWTLTVLSGPFTAGALAALNWKRIGDLRKAKIVTVLWLACGWGILLFGPSVFLPPIPFVGIIWLVVITAFISYATAGLGPLLTAHGTAGGPRGNVFLPILVALALAVPGGWLWISGVRRIVGFF
jgi:hypothetical protein